MLHSGLDLSRHRLDVSLLDERGGLLAETAVPSDADGLRGLASRLARQALGGQLSDLLVWRVCSRSVDDSGSCLTADSTIRKGTLRAVPGPHAFPRSLGGTCAS
jgi:hypothetical protein